MRSISNIPTLYAQSASGRPTKIDVMTGSGGGCGSVDMPLEVLNLYTQVETCRRPNPRNIGGERTSSKSTFRRFVTLVSQSHLTPKEHKCFSISAKWQSIDQFRQTLYMGTQLSHCDYLGQLPKTHTTPPNKYINKQNKCVRELMVILKTILRK